MPYVNPYPTNLPDVDEASLFAIHDAIVASLSDLNAALNRDALSPMSFSAGQVILGDPETVTQSLICVVGGGKQDATDIEADLEFIPITDKGGYKIMKYTNIYVYIGNKEMLPASGDPLVYCQYREVARARICGHLRKRVFNSSQGVYLTLASQEFNPDGTFDTLLKCHISRISKGMAKKGPGENIFLYSAHLLHVGCIA